MAEVDPYQTSDTPYAGFLYYHQHKLVGIRQDPHDYKRRVYVFVEQDDTKDLEKDFYHGNPLVEPLKFYKAVRVMYGRLRDFNEEN